MLSPILVIGQSTGKQTAQKGPPLPAPRAAQVACGAWGRESHDALEGRSGEDRVGHILEPRRGHWERPSRAKCCPDKDLLNFFIVMPC